MTKPASEMKIDVEPLSADDAKEILGMIHGMQLQFGNIDRVFQLKTQLNLIADGRHVVSEK